MRFLMNKYACIKSRYVYVQMQEQTTQSKLDQFVLPSAILANSFNIVDIRDEKCIFKDTNKIKGIVSAI